MFDDFGNYGAPMGYDDGYYDDGYGYGMGYSNYKPIKDLQWSGSLLSVKPITLSLY